MKILALLATIFASCHAQASVTLISTGYSDQLSTFTLDPMSCLLVRLRDQSVEENFTWLHWHNASGNLYASHEVAQYGTFGETGAVSRWRLSDNGEVFEKVEVQSSLGRIPAHFALDFENRFLHIALYEGNDDGARFATYSLNEDLSIGEVVFEEQFFEGSGVVPDRQAKTHVHQAIIFRNFVYAIDLGADKIYHYKITADGASVERADPAETPMIPGSGPRHMIIQEDTLMAYVLNELSKSVHVFAVDEVTGALEFLTSIDYILDPPTGPSDKAGELQMHPNGQILYVSNRGNGAMIVFSVVDASQGYLQQIQVVESTGMGARHFLLSPDTSCLVATGRFENILESYSIDSEGRLNLESTTDAEPSPAIIVIR